MKKAFLLLSLVAATGYGQVIDDVSPYFWEEGEVIDTAKAVTMAEQIKAEKKAEIVQANQQIADATNLLKTIQATKQKKVKTDKEKELLNFVAENYAKQYGSAVRQQVNKKNATKSKLWGNLAYLGTTNLGHSDQSVIDYVKGELERGKIDKGFAAAFDKILEELPKNISDEHQYDDADYTTLVAELPMKRGLIKVENPNCRSTHYQDWGRLRAIDKAQQTVGWEWVDEEKPETKEEKYPYDIRYEFYASHPQYRFIDGTWGSRSGYDVFDTNGNLVRVTTILNNEQQHTQHKSDYQLLGKIKDNLMTPLCILDYQNGKYDIANASKNTHTTIKKKLGITRSDFAATMERMEKISNQVQRDNSKVRSAKNTRQAINAMQQNQSGMSALAAWLAEENDEQGINYVNQLQEDHRHDFDRTYKIERLTDTSFKIYFFKDDLMATQTIQVTFYTTEPYKTDYKLDILPVEPLPSPEATK